MIRLFAPVIVCLMLVGASQATEPGIDQCELSQAAMKADEKLSFAAFDQEGATETTSRRLGERRCYPEAAKAAEHYLLHGPELTERQHNIATWHLGQYLALAGDEGAALKVIATSRRSATPEPDGFDWNSYVLGSWAFLAKDRTALDQAYQRLSAAPGERNRLNGLVLQRFQRCFLKPYREAYEGPACAPAKD